MMLPMERHTSKIFEQLARGRDTSIMRLNKHQESMVYVEYRYDGHSIEKGYVEGLHLMRRHVSTAC